MYEDLERHRDGIKEHPVIKALAGDVSDLSCDVSFLDNYDHDANSSPENVYQVLDADASQMDAITCAKKGVSFVLQGPPGTGKSQTITNIIAECMADGKKVLFVSEKMAALDVVHRRLKDSGLDDFCLVLHSHKANKKDVLAQLGRSLDLSGKRVSLKKDAYSSLARLTESRAALNTYESELHTQIKPLNMTIYEANGWVAKHDGAVDLVFDLPDVRQVSRDKLASMLSALRRYSLVVRDMGGSLDANPWRGSNLGFVGNEFRHDLSAKSKGLMASLSELSSTMQELDIECGVSAETFSDLSSASRLLGVAALSPGVPACWVWTTSVSGLTELAAAESAAQVEYFASVDRVNSYLESHELRPRLLRGDCSKAEWEPVFSTVLTAIEAQYAEDPLFSIWRGLLDLESFESFLSEFEGHSRNLVGNKDATSSVFSDEIYALDHKAVRGRFDFDYTPSFLGLRESYYEDLSCVGTFAASSILQADSDVIASELGKVARYIELQTWRNGCVEVEEYAALSADIATSCEVEINDIPYNDIYLRYKTASASFGKFLNSQYKADRALVASLMKGSVSKPADELVLDVLRKLRRRDELKGWMAESKELRELEELGAHLCDVFLPNVFEADYAGLRLRFSNDYTLDFKKTLTGYESDIAAFESCYCGNGAISRDRVIEQLARCEVVEREKKWIEENEGKGRALLGSAYFGENTDFSSVKALFRDFEELSSCRVSLLKAKELFERSLAGEARLSEAFAWKFNGLDTDWDDVRAGLDWVTSFRGVHDHLDYVDADFANRVCEEPDFSIYCADLGKRIDGLVSASSGDLAWFAGLFESNKFAGEMKVTALLDRVERCSANLIALEQWIDYRQVRGECAKIGLDNFVREVEEKAIAFDQIAPAFEKRFYRLWLDSVLPEYPAVASFRGRLQNETVDEFRNLDVAQTAIARTRVKGKLVDSLPSLDRFTMGRDEVHILQRELNKQRRIMPLRKLFSSIPNLILMLKPCLMMSPLSVSLFLESDCFQFDVVIFDEASQVCTENAIGAILRGKQAVVAGDSKQLPPSTFFSATVSDEDYDEDDESASDANAFESLLDEASLLPERTLLWHYRSRHEHLIAFSNSKIYRNRLTTFPSCVDRVSDAGVEYVYVPDGTYDRGGRKGNSAEAAKVAELVFEHFRKHPNRSLGVIAFGSAQEAAIDAAVRKLRLKDQRFEKYFGEELDEPFFVKSLENVQGDERDTIVFSIGYAKSPDGIMRMQFGPLSQTGGERRLNVAITRAKHNVKLVGSILPTDIAVERISADGPKLLRSYIDFAMRGPDALRSEVVEGEGVVHDSPFEESVYDYLVGLGYELSTQVGCSGYRIDMAVKHPTLNGRYVLGIECDGAMYHSARTARERDRLRQDVLEGMGWRIHRIWSTDWVKDPVSERSRLVEAVEKALAEFSEDPAFTGFDAGEVVDPEYDFEEVVVKVATKAERTNPYGFSKMGKVNFLALLTHFGYKQRYRVDISSQQSGFRTKKTRAVAGLGFLFMGLQPSPLREAREAKNHPLCGWS